MNTRPAATVSPWAKKGEILVQMRDVSRYFDGVIRALTHVSFEVRRGEVFGLIGQGGSGKSTVMRILAGRLAPSDGKAKVFARSPKRRAIRRRISYLPQKPSDARSRFLVQASGLFRGLVAWPKRNPRRQNAPDKPDGQERISTMKRIVLQKTQVALLDEPFSALDANGRSEMMGFIRAIAQQGRTVIVCSRSLIYPKDICDRVAVLYRGELQAIGTIQELLATREKLRFIVDLLPDEITERLLQVVRQEVGVSDLSTRSSRETQKAAPPRVNATELPAMPPMAEPAPGTILAQLLKDTTTGNAQVIEPTSTVNQEMLAALTKPTGEESPPRPEA